MLADSLLELFLAFLAGLPLLPAFLGLEEVELGKVFIILLFHFEGVAVEDIIEGKIFLAEIDWPGALILERPKMTGYFFNLSDSFGSEAVQHQDLPHTVIKTFYILQVSPHNVVVLVHVEVQLDIFDQT